MTDKALRPTVVGRYLAILFDVDGVLVESQGESDDAISKWARQRGLDVTEVIRWARGRRDVEVVQRFSPGKDAEVEAATILRYELDRAHRVVPCAGADRVLASLADAGWAAVTSAPRVLAEARLRACGLPVPRVLVAADEVARGKPDPEGYLRASRLLAVLPSRCLVLEDSEVGVAAGRAAGAAVLRIVCGEPPRQRARASTSSIAHVRIHRVGPELEVLIDCYGSADEVRAPRNTRRF